MIELFEITIAVCSTWIIASELVRFLRKDRWTFELSMYRTYFNEYSGNATSSQASACRIVDGRLACRGSWQSRR